MCCAADYLILGTDHFAESQVQANAGSKPLRGDHRGMVLVGAAQQLWGGREGKSHRSALFFVQESGLAWAGDGGKPHI